MPADYRPLRTIPRAHGWIVERTSGGSHERRVALVVAQPGPPHHAGHPDIIEVSVGCCPACRCTAPRGAEPAQERREGQGQAQAQARSPPPLGVIVDVLGDRYGYVTLHGMTLAYKDGEVIDPCPEFIREEATAALRSEATA